MKQVQSDKRVYRLWWEYLHRSDDYKEICEWWEKGANIKELAAKYKLPWGTADQSAILLDETGLSNAEYKLWNPYNQGVFYYEGEKRWRLSPMILFFEYSGDIHRISFDDWYIKMKKHAQSRRNRYKPFSLLSNTIHDDFSWCENFLRLRLGRIPTLEEFKNFIIEEYYTNPHIINIAINPAGWKPKEIAVEIEKFIVKHKKEHGLDDDDKSFSWCVEPVGRKQIDELERYIGVYDIWHEWTLQNRQGSWKRKVKEKVPYYVGQMRTDFEINSDIESDKKKALKIIQNTARGIFPGKYN